MKIRGRLFWFAAFFHISSGIIFPGSPQTIGCTPPKNNSAPAVALKMAGGLTGTVKEWLIYSDGLVCRGTRSKYVEMGRVSRQKIADLLDRIVKLGFFSMRSGKSNSPVCHQCSTFQITVGRGTMKKTVRATTMSMPRGYNDVVADVQHFIKAELP